MVLAFVEFFVSVLGPFVVWSAGAAAFERSGL